MSDQSQHDQTKMRAYEIFLEREAAGTEGDELSDWYQAENEAKPASPPANPAITP